MIKFDVLTIFPGMFSSPLSESLLKKALEKGILEIRVRNLRDYAEDKHRMTDDYPYGGGAGMVMKPEPVIRAVEEIKGRHPEARSILLTPQGEPFHQKVAREMSAHPHWILICGRYEGLDERVRLTAVDREISIGDYVLTGGEIPALVLDRCRKPVYSGGSGLRRIGGRGILRPGASGISSVYAAARFSGDGSSRNSPFGQSCPD